MAEQRLSSFSEENVFEVAGGGVVAVEDDGDRVEVIGSAGFLSRPEVLNSDFLELAKFRWCYIVFRKGFALLPFPCLNLDEDNSTILFGDNIYFAELLPLRISVIPLEDAIAFLFEVFSRDTLAFFANRFVSLREEGKYGEGHNILRLHVLVDERGDVGLVGNSFGDRFRFYSKEIMLREADADTLSFFGK